MNSMSVRVCVSTFFVCTSTAIEKVAKFDAKRLITMKIVPFVIGTVRSSGLPDQDIPD